MQDLNRRVVVTGVGMLTPLANTTNDTWEALLKGKSGANLIHTFDTTNFKTKFAAQIKNLNVHQFIPQKTARHMDPFIQYGVIAAMEAIESSGLQQANYAPERIGLAIGSGIGGISSIEESNQIYLAHGPKRVSPFFVPSTIINMIAGHVSIHYGFQGPSIAIATACSTGAHNIGLAARLIAVGDADAMIAGGAEMASSPLAISGFNSARALSTRNENPAAASRPWDKDRDGFVLGDGAGVVVLEEYSHAKKRGASILGELLGFGMSSDAYHITAPPDDGYGALRAMQNAITDAKVDRENVHYINAHGTSTLAGDIAETLAIKNLFQAHARKLLISSTKSMTGHLLGAAGSVEAIICLLALKHQIIPPTINLENPDEGCDLDYVPNKAREASIDVALSNSFGFGGTNACLLFKKVT